GHAVRLDRAGDYLSAVLLGGLEARRLPAASLSGGGTAGGKARGRDLLGGSPEMDAGVGPLGAAVSRRLPGTGGGRQPGRADLCAGEGSVPRRGGGPFPTGGAGRRGGLP